MNKKTLSIMLALLMSIVFSPILSVPSFAEETMGWQYAYAEFLGGMDGPYDFDSPQTKMSDNDMLKYYYEMKPYFYFSLRDIDNNGIPELIVRWDQGAAGHPADVYTYSNGRVKHLGSYSESGGVNTTLISDNPKYPGLFNTWGRGDDSHEVYITIKNNEVVYEIISGYDYDGKAIVHNPGLYAEFSKLKMIPDYKLTGKDIANAIYKYGKNLGANSHPYALALRDYLKNEIADQESGSVHPVAYLEDINGDGVKEMLVGRNERELKRLYYLHNGKLQTYDAGVDSENNRYSIYLSNNKHLLKIESFAEGDYIYVLKLENGQIIQETGFLGIGFPINLYTQDNKMITEAEYMRLVNKYGFSYETSGTGKNQINEILSMTNSVKAATMKSKVKINGVLREFEAYKINNNNYFKLRDLAQVVNNTSKNFEVKWDGDKKLIMLTSKKMYTSVGGELSRGDKKDKIAQLTTSKIYKDGAEIFLAAYSINGNNFFKLRDIARAFDIGLTWDSKSNTVEIDTNKGYTEE